MAYLGTLGSLILLHKMHVHVFVCGSDYYFDIFLLISLLFQKNLTTGELEGCQCIIESSQSFCTLIGSNDKSSLRIYTFACLISSSVISIRFLRNVAIRFRLKLLSSIIERRQKSSKGRVPDFSYIAKITIYVMYMSNPYYPSNKEDLSFI